MTVMICHAAAPRPNRDRIYARILIDNRISLPAPSCIPCSKHTSTNQPASFSNTANLLASVKARHPVSPRCCIFSSTRKLVPSQKRACVLFPVNFTVASSKAESTSIFHSPGRPSNNFAAVLPAVHFEGYTAHSAAPMCPYNCCLQPRAHLRPALPTSASEPRKLVAPRPPTHPPSPAYHGVTHVVRQPRPAHRHLRFLSPCHP